MSRGTLARTYTWSSLLVGGRPGFFISSILSFPMGMWFLVGVSTQVLPPVESRMYRKFYAVPSRLVAAGDCGTERKQLSVKYQPVSQTGKLLYLSLQ
jgi:hypothetical protein